MKTVSEKKAKSYTIIMDTAKTLFWKYGFKRITVEEICKDAKVSKMTFYRNFENKNNLAEQVLIREMERGSRAYDNIMALPVPFVDKIAKFVQLKHELSQDISEEFIQDIYKTDNKSLQFRIESNRKEMLSKLRSDLEKAQNIGEIRSNLKIDFVIYMLQSLNEKMLDQQLISMYRNPHDLIMELTNFIFYGLLTEKRS
jgi:AcrR family transcriptional regulator